MLTFVGSGSHFRQQATQCDHCIHYGMVQECVCAFGTTAQLLHSAAAAVQQNTGMCAVALCQITKLISKQFLVACQHGHGHTVFSQLLNVFSRVELATRPGLLSSICLDLMRCCNSKQPQANMKNKNKNYSSP